MSFLNAKFYGIPFKSNGRVVERKNPDATPITPQDVVKKIYEDDSLVFMPFYPREGLERYIVAKKRGCYEDKLTCVFHYDKDKNLKYITAQEHEDGSFCHIGGLKLFDKDGNLLKSFSKKQIERLRNYRGNLAVNLNSALRHNSVKGSVFQEPLEEMDSIFADNKLTDIIKEDTVVYRGVRVNEHNYKSWEKQLAIGSIMQEKGFLSTSTNKEHAKNQGNLLFQIKIPKGSRYLDMHLLTSPSEYYIDESEFLFNRGSKLLIKGYVPETHTIHAELIN